MFQILNCNKINSKGFVLIEVLIAVALISIVFVTLLGISFLVVNVSSSIQKETQADSLAKEELEAVRNFRDGTKWTTTGLGVVNTGSNNVYHMVNSSNKWTLASGVETTGIFTRGIVFDKVSRDSSTQNIETSYNSTHDDADTRKVTVTVSWSGKTIQDILYLTNWAQ